jgi:hypothetical protein
MKKIKLTEEQLNRLVETTTVFKDEHKMKEDVDSELGEQAHVIMKAIKKGVEDSKKCECGCVKGECKCGPDCKKCDCGKEKETKEDWNPNASVGTQPGGLMQGAHFPKWIQENKNNFKRLIK